MAHKSPGKSDRVGISLRELFRMFPDDRAAEKWLVEQRWGGEPVCPHCGSLNVQSGAKHKSMPFRCREKECGRRFSVRVGTVMEASNLGYQVWVLAMYQITTSLKGVSSLKLHRDLDVAQKSSGHLAHRLRAAFVEHNRLGMAGPAEVDESYFGGVRKNMSKSKRAGMTGRGTAGKTVVAGIKDRGTNKVRARVVPDTRESTLVPFVEENVERGAVIYTDEAGAYRNLGERDYTHQSVNHGVGEYVCQMAHTNGIESFWATLKRVHKGVYHKLSPKHLDRYVDEFAGRHNVRELDTLEQMRFLAKAMEGKRLKWMDLKADNGLDSMARG